VKIERFNCGPWATVLHKVPWPQGGFGGRMCIDLLSVRLTASEAMPVSPYVQAFPLTVLVPGARHILRVAGGRSAF
jgi:hypothetical protein